ncbi:hypothetical protein E3Q23_00137 [Wallemia mellicola]|uniref:Transcription initiation factor IIF subunit alpha n=1 Tax=Wallemia mellicola TaxID=1708541 RepID=A0A4V4N4U0_9BASI|nr:hypothetical protein E3Q23_00137 [Wallemia mellicola]TIC32175.1 Rap30/74 interaction domain-containing protein [Wallemia mellicola]TIC70183.1 Rap30/74 interaction domain-containing protein [Wallemia mellicola]
MEDTKPYTDYKLVSSSSNGYAFNVMRLNSNSSVDPANFSRPVKLNRKDPNHLLRPVPDIDPNTGKVKLDEQDRPILIDPQTNQVIPPINDKNKRFFKRKTKQVFMADEDAMQLRRTERLPWILEDSDGSQKWHGQLDGKPSDQSYIMLVFNENHGLDFKVQPTNRFYKFNQQPKYDTLSMEEADQAYSKGVDDVWFMRNRSRPVASTSNQSDPEIDNKQSIHQRLEGMMNQQPAQSRQANRRMQVDRGAVKEETFDGLFDEMEYDEEFQDDDEQVIQDNQDDDELKELEDRIKKEMHQANIGHVEQTTNLDDFEEDIKPFKQKSTSEKEMKKFLRRYDKSNADAYESDNSDDDDDEEEEERKKQEQDREQQRREREKKEQQDKDQATNLAKSIKREQSPASLAAHEVARRATSPYAKQRSSSPSTKRSRTDLEDKPDNKKLKVKRESSSPSATPPNSADGQVLQGDEIIAFLRGKSVTTNELIQHFKKRFKAQPKNRETIGGVLKKVASRTPDGKLQLKEGL